MAVDLTGYRSWSGPLRPAWRSPWPIARVALATIFRRRLFWFLYGLALFNFLFVFFGTYLLSQIKGMSVESRPTGILAIFGNMRGLARLLEDRLHLNGSGETYRRFFWMQGYIVMGVLAMAGSILIGNDYRHGSLPFYLAKPLRAWHYLSGKLLALALFINLTTTLPALVLYVEYAMLEDWGLLRERAHLIAGILGYGAMMTVVLSLMVVAMATWLRKAVPLVLIWAVLLVFCRIFSRVLVERLGFDVAWRLIDIWNNLYVVGSWTLGEGTTEVVGLRVVQHPEPWQAAAVLIAVCIGCILYLRRRIQAVEVIA